MLLARTSSEELYTHHKASFLRWDNDPDNPVSMVRVGQPGESLAVGGREKKPLVCLFAFIVGLYVVVATYFLFAVEMIPMYGVYKRKIHDPGKLICDGIVFEGRDYRLSSGVRHPISMRICS